MRTLKGIGLILGILLLTVFIFFYLGHRLRNSIDTTRTIKYNLGKSYLLTEDRIIYWQNSIEDYRHAVIHDVDTVVFNVSYIYGYSNSQYFCVIKSLSGPAVIFFNDKKGFKKHLQNFQILEMKSIKNIPSF